jgi:hypothetical protein
MYVKRIINGVTVDDSHYVDKIARLEEVLEMSRSEVQGLSRKIAEYQRLEEQGLLIRANNGDCEHCKLLADFGDCSVFGYGKDTREKCKHKGSLLKGSVSE